MAESGPCETDAMHAEQEAAITFLSDPASYRDVKSVERQETHGNLVFLAGAEAWKVKRAVQFAYMDFSTLEKRRVACFREVEINRRFGSDLYLGPVPITRSRTGELAFGGDGDVIEWTVHMRRFDQSALLSHIARKSGIANGLAADLADLVYDAHQLAQRFDPPSGTTYLRSLAASIAGTLSKSAIARFDERQLTDKLNAEICRAASTLNARATKGFIRRCHGDLHLDNIVVWQGRPALYDAIEFDEAIATIDTLYDLGFLLMDLDRYGQRAAANLVLNRYLWRSGDDLDLRGLDALALFLALRAGVRAMVIADRAAQKTSDARESDLKIARSYLQAALAYLAPRRPELIAIGGLSGTGKSTLAGSLAPRLGSAPGAIHLRTDLERKRLAGVSEFDRLPTDAYTTEARLRVYQVLREKARWVLAAGHSAIVDAVFAEPEERRDIEAVAAQVGVPFRGLWLHAGAEKLRQRVAARRKDASDATPEVVDRQLCVDPGPFTAEWATIEAGGTAKHTLGSALALLTQLERPTP